MLNYMSRAQLSLSEDLPHGFYRLFCLKLSGSDHFLLFAFGTVGGKDCDLRLCGFTLTVCPTLNSRGSGPKTGKKGYAIMNIYRCTIRKPVFKLCTTASEAESEIVFYCQGGLHLRGEGGRSVLTNTHKKLFTRMNGIKICVICTVK